MAIANTGTADVVAYYGTTASCTKYRLHQQDWAAAKQAPDAALWSLSAQSSTIADKSISVAALPMGDPGSTTAGTFSAKGDLLEPTYAVNSAARARTYPGP